MRKSLRKIVYLAGGVIYALMVAAVFSQRPEMTDARASSEVTSARGDHAGGDLQSTLVSLDSSGSDSAILLPLGPNDGRLPGLQQIWDGFLQSGDVVPATADEGGFDGLQAVDDLAEFSQNKVAGLFLSGYPDQIFVHSKTMLVLNTHNKVQIIDCERPDAPKLSGYLPYNNVTHMEMRGDIAYLLMPQSNAPHDLMVVADLRNPMEPLELARLSLPKSAETFFFTNRQLVVYVNSLDKAGAHLGYVYDLLEDDRLALVGSAACPLLRDNFLKFGHYILVPGARSGVHVYDFSDPLKPVETAFIDVRDNIRTLVRHDDKVFALGGLDRVYLLDLHVPEKPIISAVVKNAKYPALFISYRNYTYYFSLQGYLQVYDSTPYDMPNRKHHPLGGPDSDLIVMQDRPGFTLLGKKPEVFPEGVDSSIAFPADGDILDSAAWQDGVVSLGEDGLIRFFSNRPESQQKTMISLQLPVGQRWLAAGPDRLYVGGGSTLSVIARGDNGQLLLSGQVDLPGKESWDGLILQQILCIAAGKDGLLTYSLESPDKPSAAKFWEAPQQLQSQLDVRQLASPGGLRLLAAAGRIGMLDGQVSGFGQFELQGLLSFRTRVSTLAVIKPYCLVATENDVQVVDLRDAGVLQKLGRISFSGVTRLAVAPPGHWAGFVPGTGWFVLRVPHVLSTGDVRRLRSAKQPGYETDQQLYRLNVFNADGVKTIPGLLRFTKMSARPKT